jgi:MoaA/NifB/PqqE/SkfB family radical SAM enzyme
MANPGIDLAGYIDLPVWYGCNNDCIICMLSGLKHRLPTVGFDLFKQSVAHMVGDGRYRNLILSGAEVTTFDFLDRYVRFAASFGWFNKIQIQTNGRKLSDPDYAEKLIASGVNEFFISVHGLEAVHDLTTRTIGSFKQTITGIRNLVKYDVSVITNTVLTKINYNGLSDAISFLCREKVNELQLWNYCPMERADSKDLLVGMKDLVRVLPVIREKMMPTGKALVLKHFPQCLPVSGPVFLDSRVPLLLIHEIFWRQFDENRFGSCIHRKDCSAVDCAGLSRAYIEKFGDEKDLLCPITQLETRADMNPEMIKVRI